LAAVAKPQTTPVADRVVEGADPPDAAAVKIMC